MILLDLLATLHATELAAFEKHLKTAHANERIALRTFAHFKQFHPRFADGAQLDLDFVVRKLQRQKVVGARFTRKQLSSTCSDLYGWLKDFLLMKKARDKSLESEHLWLTVLRERGLAAAQGRAEAAMFGRAWSTPKEDAWAYCWNMAAHYAAYFESKSDKVGKSGEAIKALTACRLALDQFYDVCRRQVNCELLNWHSPDGATADRHEEDAPPMEPLAELYGKAEALLSGGGMAAYEALEGALGELSEFVAENERYRIWAYLKNYNSKRLTKGDQAAWERLDRLDRFALQHGLLNTETSRVSPIQFLNMINIAANRGDYQRAAALKTDFIADIEERMRNEVSILADAILLFSQKKYAEVFQQLQQFDDYGFREPHLAIRYRTLKLMSMYELGMDADRLYDDAMSFDAFLRRSENPWKNTAKATLAFLRFYKKLVLAKPNPQQIMADIRAANPFYKDWLLEKFEHYRPVK